MSNYILVHHGILGQKWGVRRYQNPDGTLTEAGKRKYKLYRDEPGRKEIDRKYAAEFHEFYKRNPYGAEDRIEKHKWLDLTKRYSDEVEANQKKNLRAGHVGKLIGEKTTDSEDGKTSNFTERLKASGRKNKYVNDDGSLTEEGEKRYEKEVRRNKQKSKKNRADEDSLRDPDKWVEDDMNRVKDSLDAGRKMTQDISNIERSTRRKSNPRMELNNYSDKELREMINRELLERQYNEVFNAPQVSKGREFVSSSLDLLGKGLSVASGIVTIAVALKKLKSD